VIVLAELPKIDALIVVKRMFLDSTRCNSIIVYGTVTVFKIL
jgi:hypothetical protein